MRPVREDLLSTARERVRKRLTRNIAALEDASPEARSAPPGVTLPSEQEVEAEALRDVVSREPLPDPYELVRDVSVLARHRKGCASLDDPTAVCDCGLLLWSVRAERVLKAWSDGRIEAPKELRPEEDSVFTAAQLQVRIEEEVERLRADVDRSTIDVDDFGIEDRAVKDAVAATEQKERARFTEAMKRVEADYGARLAQATAEAKASQEALDAHRAATAGEKAAPPQPAAFHRERLPDERPSVCHKFRVGGHKGYVHVGFFSDGRPGEVFLKMAKQGSTVSGFCDAVGILISMLLQSGWSVEEVAGKLRGMSFEPQGWTGNAELIKSASSVLDYLAQWLLIRFPGRDK